MGRLPSLRAEPGDLSELLGAQVVKQARSHHHSHHPLVRRLLAQVWKGQLVDEQEFEALQRSKARVLRLRHLNPQFLNAIEDGEEVLDLWKTFRGGFVFSGNQWMRAR